MWRNLGFCFDTLLSTSLFPYFHEYFHIASPGIFGMLIPALHTDYHKHINVYLTDYKWTQLLPEIFRVSRLEIIENIFRVEIIVLRQVEVQGVRPERASPLSRKIQRLQTIIECFERPY